MKFEQTARINANAKKVFDAASDVQKLDKWIPPKLHEKLIEDNAGNFMLAEHARPDQAKKRLTWNDGSPSGYKSWVQINEQGPASDVTIHVETPASNVTQAEIDKFLVQALGSLDKQVTASGAGASR